MKKRAKAIPEERQGELFAPVAVDWGKAYEDEVDAAEHGVLFQPGCVPQRGKKLTNVIDLDPPGAPHWLSGPRKREGHKRK